MQCGTKTTFLCLLNHQTNKIKTEDDENVLSALDDYSSDKDKPNRISAIALFSALVPVTTDHDLFHFDSDSIELCLDACFTRGLT